MHGEKEEREEAGMAAFTEQLCARNPNQWVISTSLATNIYLKLFTEGRAVQLESRGTEISSRIVFMCVCVFDMYTPSDS